MSPIILLLTIYMLPLLSYYPAEMVVIKLPHTVPPAPTLHPSLQLIPSFPSSLLPDTPH